ncbi:MAG: ribonuclease Z [Flavobacteriales bacterium]|nr:ribonuclease Z [Flavobacteriales bacterium]
MKIEKHDNYILIKEDLSFENFRDEFSLLEVSDSVVVDLSALNLSNSQIEELSVLSSVYKKGGMSFAVVVSNISVDEVDEALSVAPTLQEAIDVVSMEDLERELGF